MNEIVSVPNPDLVVLEGNMSYWTHADHRRHGWHNLSRIGRYGISLRSARVMTLTKSMDLRIAELEDVRHLTSSPWFSAMVVLRGQEILFERYAPDFESDQLHSIQSITKTTINLMVGGLLEQGLLDLSKPVNHYIPEIGSGYGAATIQQVLNMDVTNNYSEEFDDPSATYFQHEEAMGWRLPIDDQREESEHSFLPKIESLDTTNRSRKAQYKDANAAVMGWVIERASSRSLRSLLADIVDAAGIEGSFYFTTDRSGVPTVEGGGCLTARDLARYFSIFARRGRGVRGEIVANQQFFEDTLASGVSMSSPYEGMRYSNHCMVSGRMIGHGGWGGQYAMANPDTGVVVIFLSVVESRDGGTGGRIAHVIRVLAAITEMQR
jgi:CubicO group peptidase (beta-lactamase class C family)